jgi:hypothetical protein
MSPAAFTMHTLTVSRDTSRPAKYSIFLSLGCHTECHDSRLGSTARLLHLLSPGARRRRPRSFDVSKNRHGRFRESDLLWKLFETVVARCIKERIVGGERACTQDRALHSRSRSRQGPRNCKDRGLRRLTSRTNEGRDALRSFEAHPQARPIAPARAERSQRAATAQNLRKMAKLIPIPTPVFAT